MDYDILNDTILRMKKCFLEFQNNINKMHVDRASPALLDNIFIDYYGVKTSLKELSNITVENSNTLKISVFDRNILRLVEKSIFHSKLEITPVIRDNFIKVILPALTEERRINFCKSIQIDAENNRIKIRNIRRDSNDKLKQLIKKKIITSDMQYKIQNEIQKLTDDYINEIDKVFIQKKSEIMNI